MKSQRWKKCSNRFTYMISILMKKASRGLDLNHVSSIIRSLRLRVVESDESVPVQTCCCGAGERKEPIML